MFSRVEFSRGDGQPTTCLAKPTSAKANSFFEQYRALYMVPVPASYRTFPNLANGSDQRLLAVTLDEARVYGSRQNGQCWNLWCLGRTGHHMRPRPRANPLRR